METQNQKQHEQLAEQAETKKLPLSYVMYLTMRSRFIDALALNDTEVLNKWKEYENLEIKRIQNWHNSLNTEEG